MMLDRFTARFILSDNGSGGGGHSGGSNGDDTDEGEATPEDDANDTGGTAPE
jgi:hypothetical protein